MAKQSGPITFSGKLYDVIGYRRNTKFFLRSRPTQVRQTFATRKAAKAFGAASRKGRLIRHTLLPLLDLPYDGSLTNRLNKALIATNNNNANLLHGFQLSKHTSLHNFITTPAACHHTGTIYIPPQKWQALDNITHLEIKLVAVKIDLTKLKILDTQSFQQIIDYNTPFSGLQWTPQLSPKGTLLVTLQIRAYKNGITAKGRLHVAADILTMTTPLTKTRRKVIRNRQLRQLRKLLPYHQLPATIPPASHTAYMHTFRE